jgi:DNA-binding response OmpR family regulator
VLVVEDTWHVAQALKSVLEQMGMDVSGPAATTAAARRLAAEHTPSIAVVDVNLGGETSCALIEELCDQNIRVIVISGYAMPPVRAHKTAAILQKPFSASELSAALQSVAAQTRQ